jgi:hypothetical protein
LGYQTGNNFLKLSVLLRTRELMRIYTEIEEKYRIKERIGNDFSELFKLISTIILLAHYIACSWHYVAVLASNRA